VRTSGTAHYVSSVEKEQQMRKIKELHACIARLQAVLAGNDVGPEQRKDIIRAMEQIRQIQRKPHPTQREVSCAVREITDALLRAFLKF
jgi:signal recognition particle GTPase